MTRILEFSPLKLIGFPRQVQIKDPVELVELDQVIVIDYTPLPFTRVSSHNSANLKSLECQLRVLC